MQEGDALAYFYCKYDEAERHDPESILRALVKQLATISSQLPEPIVSIYKQRKAGGFLSGPLALEESRCLIAELIRLSRQTAICIDALDECDKNARGKLLSVLTDLPRSSSKPVKIFVASRDDDDIMLRLDDYPNFDIGSRDNSSDMEQFVHAEIEKCIADKQLLRGRVGPELKAYIISTLISRASGMYGTIPFVQTCSCTC
jgi:hypothetical protein